jgi:beta-glucosidase
VTEDGEFDLLIGASSQDIRYTETVTLQSSLRLPSLLHQESTINEWLSDPCGKKAFAPLHQMMVAHIQELHGDSEAGREKVSMELMGMGEMPLLSILQFDESRLPMPAEELVDMLLGQVRQSNP